jgi:Icc-related predicted phosphoesterase
LLSIAIIGDVHASERRLSASLTLLDGTAFDLALLVGDLGLDPPRGWRPDRPDAAESKDRRRPHDESVRRVVGSVRDSLNCPVVFVPGNHDLRDPPAIEGAMNADGTTLQCCGLSIAGLGGAGPDFFGFPYEWTEAEAESALKATLGQATEPPDILISHTPPIRSALDRTMYGKHAGSEAVRHSVETVQPRLFLCGHIHEAWGVAQVAGVPCINAGALGPPAEQNIAWLVTWDHGPTRIQMRREIPDGSTQSRSWDPSNLNSD